MSLIFFKENGFWGFKNIHGEIIIPATLLNFESLNNGFTLVCTEKRPDRKFYLDENINNYRGDFDFIWGLINEQGEFVIESNYKNLEIVSNRYAVGILYAGPGLEWNDYCQNKIFVVNYDNKKSKDLGRYREASILNNGFCLTESGRDPVGKDYCWLSYKIFNLEGIEVIKFSGGTSISDFENDIIKLGNSSVSEFYNTDGNLLHKISIDVRNISKNLGGYYILRENESFFKLDQESFQKEEISKDIQFVWSAIQSKYSTTSTSY